MHASFGGVKGEREKVLSPPSPCACIAWPLAVCSGANGVKCLLVGIAARHATDLGLNPIGRRFILSKFTLEKIPLTGEVGLRRDSEVFKSRGCFLLLMKIVRAVLPHQISLNVVAAYVAPLCSAGRFSTLRLKARVPWLLYASVCAYMCDGSMALSLCAQQSRGSDRVRANLCAQAYACMTPTRVSAKIYSSFCVRGSFGLLAKDIYQTCRTVRHLNYRSHKAEKSLFLREREPQYVRNCLLGRVQWTSCTSR